jgi:hypothetical protein
MFPVDFTPDALEDLQLFRAYEQQQIIQSGETRQTNPDYSTQ